VALEDVLETGHVDGIDDLNISINTEAELQQWSEQVCTRLLDTYIKAGSSMEVNLSAKIRQDCLSLYQSGKHHPSIFMPCIDSFTISIITNDLPKFKAFALDRNIEIQHRNLRLLGLVLSLAASLAFYISMLASKSSQYYRLLGLPLLLGIFWFYFQWQAKFCVSFADRKKKNTKGYMGVGIIEDEYACQYQGKRSKMIKTRAITTTIILYIILFVVPPYQW